MTIKVLFTAGWSRSGTTLLDNLLGSYPGVVTVGELTRLCELSFLEGRTCGCGAPLPECGRWQKVAERAFPGGRWPDPRRMLHLQRTVITTRRTPSLVAAARSGHVNADVDEYVDVVSRLYRAVAEESGARIVVDASKRPSDAVVAAMCDGIEPHLLHMIRDPRACAFSWQRRKVQPDTADRSEMDRHGPLMNASHWLGWNAASELTTRAYPRDHRSRVRYEDFSAHPRETVSDILGGLGESPQDGPFCSSNSAQLASNHTVAGNPVRFRTGEVRITADDEWRSAQRPLDRLLTTAVSLPLLHRYGYSVSL